LFLTKKGGNEKMEAIYFPRLKRHDYLFLPLIKKLPQAITPNVVTCSRLVLILPLILLMYGQIFKPAGCVYIFAALLDALDGSIARYRNQETKLGAFLDPLADKAVNFATFLGFNFYIKSSYYFSLILPIIIIDLMLFFIATVKFLIKVVLPDNHWLCQRIAVEKIGANNWGKAKMVTQVSVLVAYYFFDPNSSLWIHEKYSFLPHNLTLFHLSNPLLIACILLGLMSSYGHIKAFRIIRPQVA